MLRGSVKIGLEVKEHFILDGLPRPDARFQFYGIFNDRNSLANVCAQYSRVLTRQLGGVALQGYTGPSFNEAPLREYAGVNRSAPIGMFYGLPDKVRDSLDHHAVKIGGFACETDRIHPTWVEACNRLDLVVVPSRFCRDAFMDSGVTVPVTVVSHGLEPEYRPYAEKRRSASLVFYNTFNAESFYQRKSCEELIRCFNRAFDKGEDVVLRLRTQDSPLMDEYRGKYDFSRITVEPVTRCSTEQFARIYSEVHCTVHPSKGEGFGLIPFQSIACETPVIAAPVTGMADYLNEDNAMLLRTAGRVAGIGIGNRSGTYYRIDEDHLVELLRHAYANWEAEYARVRAVGPAFRAAHSWESVLAEFVTEMKQLLAAEDIRAGLADLSERVRAAAESDRAAARAAQA